MVDLPRRLAAEALGTLLLVATVVGSGIMATRLTDDVALALLANALATAGMLVVLITMLAPISGAHFNPAVTMVLAARREIGVRAALLYVLVQLCGAIAGTLLAHTMFDAPVLQLSEAMRTGPAQWLSEGVATFGLVLVILLVRGQGRVQLASAIGLYIGSAYWFTASTSFANPAVTLARAFTDTFAGIAPMNVPAFILAQLAGAALATVTASLLQPRETLGSP
jgi:glycerol uptake facilitator-like aquaporin